VGGSAFATSVNSGLVTALNSVGQNLFGVQWPTDPLTPPDPIRLDFGDNAQLPVTVNVFNKQFPGDPTAPCRSYLQVAIKERGAPLFPLRKPASRP
jgi:hypothetical protein